MTSEEQTQRIIALEAVSNPDQIVTHEPYPCCGECGCDLSTEIVVGVIKRQVFDIPEPKIEVTKPIAGIESTPSVKI